MLCDVYGEAAPSEERNRRPPQLHLLPDLHGAAEGAGRQTGAIAAGRRAHVGIAEERGVHPAAELAQLAIERVAAQQGLAGREAGVAGAVIDDHDPSVAIDHGGELGLAAGEIAEEGASDDRRRRRRGRGVGGDGGGERRDGHEDGEAHDVRATSGRAE